MKVKPLPPTEVLQERLAYDPTSGKVFWKPRPVEHFEREREYPAYSADRECKRWNTRYAGKEAGNLSDEGYLTVRLSGSSYKLHRIIWKLETGVEPPEVLDHKDRDRANNRWNNLRPSNDSANQMNKAGWGNTCDQIGVRVRNGRWQARIHKNGTSYDLGWFASQAEATTAYKAKAAELYGEFA